MFQTSSGLQTHVCNKYLPLNTYRIRNPVPELSVLIVSTETTTHWITCTFQNCFNYCMCSWPQRPLTLQTNYSCTTFYCLEITGFHQRCDIKMCLGSHKQTWRRRRRKKERKKEYQINENKFAETRKWRQWLEGKCAQYCKTCQRLNVTTANKLLLPK